jgi:hypothetical protein
MSSGSNTNTNTAAGNDVSRNAAGRSPASSGPAKTESKWGASASTNAGAVVRNTWGGAAGNATGGQNHDREEHMFDMDGEFLQSEAERAKKIDEAADR